MIWFVGSTLYESLGPPDQEDHPLQASKKNTKSINVKQVEN